VFFCTGIDFENIGPIVMLEEFVGAIRASMKLNFIISEKSVPQRLANNS